MKLTIDRALLEHALNAILNAAPQTASQAKEQLESLLALRKALAQPQQEPVGEVTDALGDAFKCEFKVPLSVGTKLYTSPPARKPIWWHTLPDTLPPKRKGSDRWSQRVWLALPDGSVVAGDCLFACLDATHGHAVHAWFGDRRQLDADPIAWMPFAVPDHPRCLPAPPAQQSPWCMKMNGCKTKCEDCPDEAPKQRKPLTDWVNVDERLPEKGGYYLVTVDTDDGPHVDVLLFNGKYWEHEGEPTFCHSYLFSPTHWANRPEAAHGIKEAP